MKIVVLSDDVQWMEMQPFINSQWVRVAGEQDFFSTTDATVYINLLGNASSLDYSGIQQVVLINSVCTTLKEMNANSNIVRLNGWPTFLNRTTWELCGVLNETLNNFFASINKRIILTPDEPGFVSARVVAMIINEAYFALQEEVSTKAEIDIAMKMGTNYPFGPFEWSDRIGLQNITALLNQLAVVNKRYTPARLLLHESETHAHHVKH